MKKYLWRQVILVLFLSILTSCAYHDFRYRVDNVSNLEPNSEFIIDTKIWLAGAKRISYDAHFTGEIVFRVLEYSAKDEPESSFKNIDPYVIVGPGENIILDSGNDFYAEKAILRIISLNIEIDGDLDLRIDF